MPAPIIHGTTTADVTTKGGGSSSFTTFAMDVPTSAVAGDMLIAFVGWRTNSADITASWTGADTWVRKFQGTETWAMFYVHLTEAPPAICNFTSTLAARYAAMMVRVTGAAAGDPTDVLGNWTTGSLSPFVASSVTTTDPNTLLLYAVGGNNGTTHPYTFGAPLTEVRSFSGTTGAANGVSLGIAQQTLSVAGATGTRSSTSASANTANSRLWAIKGTSASIPGMKVYNGSSFSTKPVKVWDGSAWVQKPLKRWNGTTWL